MAKGDADYILARLRAKAKGEPVPVNPRIVHEVSPATGPKARPLAELLAQDAFVPKTEWEKAYEHSQVAAKAQANGKGANLHTPYVFRGKVGPIQKLSELPKEEPEEQYTGTPQQRIRLQNIKAKIIRNHKLTIAERKFWGRFNMARILARVGRK